MTRAIATAVLLLVATPAAALDCHPTKGDGGHWSWRSINHRHCWYRGYGHISKAALHWPHEAEGQSSPAARNQGTVPEPPATDDAVTSQPNYELLSASYWPALEQPWALADRFGGTSARKLVRTISVGPDQ